MRDPSMIEHGLAFAIGHDGCNRKYTADGRRGHRQGRTGEVRAHRGRGNATGMANPIGSKTK